MLASGNGLPIQAQTRIQIHKLDARHLSIGDARDATFFKTSSQLRTPVGAARSRILVLYLAFHPTPVDKLVARLAYIPENALIRASYPVTLVHALPANIQVLAKYAFVASRQRSTAALILIMSMVGAAAVHVVTRCYAESMHASELVMKGFVEHVKCQSRLDAIAARTRELSFVPIALVTLELCVTISMTTDRQMQKNGPENFNVRICVKDSLIVESIDVKRAVIPCLVLHLTALDHLTLSRPVRVDKHRSIKYSDKTVSPARTPYRTAPICALSRSFAAIPAKVHAI